MIAASIVILLAFTGSVDAVDAKGCFDKDASCSNWEIKNLCTGGFSKYYQDLCPKTCGVCGNVCYDEAPEKCRSLKDDCNSTGYEGLSTICKYSCNVCTGKDHCGDVFSACTQMKDFCEVKAFEDVMSQCNYTCGKCECEDLYPDFCEIMKDSCNYGNIRNECPVTCGVCPKKCADLRPDCARFANFCNHTEFKVPMKHSCARTCGFCGEEYTAGSGGWIYSRAFSAWYKYICEPLPFFEMEKRCVENGGHLASVHSANEILLLSNMNQCSNDRIWLGWDLGWWIDLTQTLYWPVTLNCGTSGNFAILDTKNVGWCMVPHTAAYGGICKVKITKK